jgi:hypothetical protein
LPAAGGGLLPASAPASGGFVKGPPRACCYGFTPAPAPCHPAGLNPEPQQQSQPAGRSAAGAAAGAGGRLGSWQLVMSCQGQTSGGARQLAAPVKLTLGQEELARLRGARVLQYQAAYQR